MNILRLMALGVVPLALGACSTGPSASSMADGNVAINVSTLNEAPLPNPQTQQMAEQQCAGGATYMATENLSPFSARHLYHCGTGGSTYSANSGIPSTTTQSTGTGTGNINAGYPAYGNAPALSVGTGTTGHMDGGVSSTDLPPM